MKIGSVSENQKIEQRISITPEIVKKYISIGFEVHLSKNYGVHLGISDEEFSKYFRQSIMMKFISKALYRINIYLMKRKKTVFFI